MVGRALIFVFGIPCLIAAIIFGKMAYQNECTHHLGTQFCGPGLYIYSAIFIVILLMVLFLAYIWRD